MSKTKERELLFSPKNIRLLTSPLGKENPITMQVLGICSALAVTVQIKPAVVMGISVIVVTAVGNLIISAMRNSIPNRIRIIVQLVVIATLVILVDQVLRAFSYEVSKQLSVFVGLIITNCILMGRFEAFAMANKPWPSFLDGIGNGLGYGIILVVVAVVRGSLMGYKIIPESFYNFGYSNNGLMIMPPLTLIIVASIIWFQRSRDKDLIEK